MYQRPNHFHSRKRSKTHILIQLLCRTYSIILSLLADVTSKAGMPACNFLFLSKVCKGLGDWESPKSLGNFFHWKKQFFTTYRYLEQLKCKYHCYTSAHFQHHTTERQDKLESIRQWIMVQIFVFSQILKSLLIPDSGKTPPCSQWDFCMIQSYMAIYFALRNWLLLHAEKFLIFIIIYIATKNMINTFQ